MRKVVLLVPVALLLLAAPMACTTTIVPPPDVRDPVTVFVAPVAWTSSLVLPRADGRLARFVYGDWRYYALAENTVPNGIRALVWPTQGTLGHAVLPGPAAADHVAASFDNDAIHEVQVERQAVALLLDELEHAYERQRDTEVENQPYRMKFVHQEPRYTYFYNSNHAIADWLRRLGCEVRGPAFGSRWRVQEAR
jgi:hypothetical protein